MLDLRAVARVHLVEVIVCDSVAVYSLTGTLTIPKVIVPFQIERGAIKLAEYLPPSRPAARFWDC